jgi:hypothetical protein
MDPAAQGGREESLPSRSDMLEQRSWDGRVCGPASKPSDLVPNRDVLQGRVPCQLIAAATAWDPQSATPGPTLALRLAREGGKG